MSLYSGFFNAQETGGIYDRTYSADEIVEYYSNFVGSGVCVSKSADSFKVSLSGTTAVIAPGYLFINGYWLKSDSDYTIAMPSSGTYAILAKLDTTNREITLTQQAVAQTYPNALCLASINMSTRAVVDMRDDATVCGVIEDLHDVAEKAITAAEYVETTIPQTLSALRASVSQSVANINGAADNVNSAALLLEKPQIGEIRYSAQAPSEKWILCDGRYVSASEYPGLVSLLGKLQLATKTDVFDGVSNSTGLYAQDDTLVSNGVIHSGFLYFAQLILTDDQLSLSVIRIALSSLNVTRVPITGILAHSRGTAGDGNIYFGTSREPICLSVTTYGNRQHFFVMQQCSGSGVHRVTGVAFCMSGTTVTNAFDQGKLGAFNVSLSGAGYKKALPYVYISASGWFFALCSAQMGASSSSYVQTTHVKCSVLPLSGNTIDTSSFSTFTTTTATDIQYSDFSQAAFGYSYVNGDARIVTGSARWAYAYNQQIGVMQYLLGYAYTSYAKYIFGGAASVSYQAKYTNVDYGSDERDSSGASIDLGDDHWPTPSYIDGAYTDRVAGNLPLQAGGYVIGPVQIGCKSGQDGSLPLASRIVAMVLRISDRKMYTVPLDDNASPYSRVFPWSVAYAQGYFFIFVGTGIFFTSDPTDIWSYVSTVNSIGTIVRNGGLAYDSTNNRMFVYGLTEDLIFTVKTVPISAIVSASTSTVALPNVSRGGIPGYIKAVSG